MEYLGRGTEGRVVASCNCNVVSDARNIHTVFVFPPSDRSGNTRLSCIYLFIESDKLEIAVSQIILQQSGQQ